MGEATSKRRHGKPMRSPADTSIIWGNGDPKPPRMWSSVQAPLFSSPNGQRLPLASTNVNANLGPT